MAKNTLPYIIIGAVLIVALISAGPILTGLGNLIGKLRNLFVEDWETYTQGNATLSGVIFLVVEILYDDGTNLTVDGTKTTHSVIPLTVFDSSGKSVASIRVYAYLTLDYYGQIGTCDFSGTLKTYLDDNERKSETLANSWTSSNAPTSTEPEIIGMIYTTSYEIEDWDNNEYKDRIIKYVTKGTCNVKFANGDTEEWPDLTAEAKISLSIVQANYVTSAMVTVSAVTSSIRYNP